MSAAIKKQSTKLAKLVRNAEGDLMLDEENSVMYMTEDGLQFYIPKHHVVSNAETLLCEVGDVLVTVMLTNSDKEQAGIVDPINISPTLQESSTIMDNNMNENKESSFSWTDQSTKFFLTLYKEKKELVTVRKIKTFKMMWKQIASKMIEEGYNVSSLQVENRFKTLERVYKNTISNNKKTGRGRATCSYESELSELIGNKHSLIPLAVSSKEGLRVREDVLLPKNLNIEHIVHRPLKLVPQTGAAGSGLQSVALSHDEVNVSTIDNNPTPLKKTRSTNTTAKSIAMCQKAIEDLMTDRREQQTNRQQFEEEYRNFMKKTLEQREIANEQRAKKIVLLEKLISLVEENK